MWRVNPRACLSMAYNHVPVLGTLLVRYHNIIQIIGAIVFNCTKNGTDKGFATQWLRTSPNSTMYMTSFKFYVKTPFFNKFI